MAKVTFPGIGSLRSAEHDIVSGVLSVEFSSGEIRCYSLVTVEEFAEFSASEKPGKWFSDKIRSRPKAHPEVTDEVPAAPASKALPSAPALVIAAPDPLVGATTKFAARNRAALRRWSK